MEILKTIITACGGAAVAGIFSLILSNRKNKSEIVKRLDALDGKLVKHIEDDANCRADEARSRILRFGDEVRQGVLHTAEHWADVLRDVDRYEKFCAGHPLYENNRAANTIQYLNGIYASHLAKNDFLK
nr:MAG TPA: hypothetical protein [Caudoviricetes sp.]